MPINVTELTKTGIYQATAPLAIIARDMDEIDALRLSRKKRRNQFFILALVALVVGLIVMTVGMTVTRFAPLAGVPLLIAFGGLVWVGTIANRGILAAPERTNLVKGLVAMLAADAHSKAPVSIWISLDQKGTTLCEEPWLAKKKGKERRASCEWLRLEAPMLDGTGFSQTITDFFRDRSYVNPRGKSKKKRRTTSEVVQKYRFPAEIYGDPARFPEEEVGTLINLPHSATLRGLRVSEKALTARVQVKLVEADLLQSCTMLSLGVYRILNLARRVNLRGTAQ